MAKAIFFLVLTLVGLAASVCRFNPSPRVGLDHGMYSGTWFLLETGPLKVGEGPPLNCVYESYQLTENRYVLSTHWMGKHPNGTDEMLDGIVTVDSTTPSKLDFFLDGTVFKSMVVATDYTSWAIEYTCHEAMGYERFMLRSRQSTLPQVVRTTLHQVINGFGVNVSDFAVVNHVGCF